MISTLTNKDDKKNITSLLGLILADHRYSNNKTSDHNAIFKN